MVTLSFGLTVVTAWDLGANVRAKVHDAAILVGLFLHYAIMGIAVVLLSKCVMCLSSLSETYPSIVH